MSDDREPLLQPDQPFETFIEESRRFITGASDVPLMAPAFDDEKRQLPQLPVFDVSSFAGKPVPPRAWHVAGLLPARNVTLLMADGAVGKSTLAVHLTVCTKLGRPWLGRSCEAGAVVFLSAEDDLDELHRRFDAVAAYEGVRIEDLPGITLVPLAGLDAILAAPGGPGGLLQPTPKFLSLKALLARLRPKLLIVDTLADTFGGDEIKKAHARQFVTMLRGLAVDFGLAVLLLGHPSQSGMASGAGTSGNTAWSNSVRSRLYLDRLPASEGVEPDPDLRILSVKKSNYAPAGSSIPLRWRDGVFTVEIDGPQAPGTHSTTFVEQTFMDLLRLFDRQGRPVTSIPCGNHAPRLFAAHPESRGISKRGFSTALETLMARETIGLEWSGPPSKSRSRLVIRSQQSPCEDAKF